jgi:hypothetical protein
VIRLSVPNTYSTRSDAPLPLQKLELAIHLTSRDVPEFADRGLRLGGEIPPGRWSMMQKA